MYQVMYSVTYYIDFIKVFFTFEVSYSFMVNVNVIVFTPVRKVWLSFCLFLQNFHILNSIIFRSLMSCVTEIGQCLCKHKIEMLLMSLSKIWLSMGQFLLNSQSLKCLFKSLNSQSLKCLFKSSVPDFIKNVENTGKISLMPPPS